MNPYPRQITVSEIIIAMATSSMRTLHPDFSPGQANPHVAAVATVQGQPPAPPARRPVVQFNNNLGMRISLDAGYGVDRGTGGDTEPFPAFVDMSPGLAASATATP
jgi:hypothetical protein